MILKQEDLMHMQHCNLPCLQENYINARNMMTSNKACFHVYSTARRSYAHAALQPALSARELPDEVLPLPWPFMATAVVCS